MRFAIPLFAAAATLLLALPAQAQDSESEPSYGTVDLAAGFQPETQFVELLAGGDIDASVYVTPECSGYIAEAPDFRVNYTAGAATLSFLATSFFDTTLVINRPDGEWVCDDEGTEGDGSSDPLVSFVNPQSGQYDVWVGMFDAPVAEQATLYITEADLTEE